MIQHFAHSGEVHTTSTQSTSHLIGEWYIAIPLITIFFGAILFGVLGMLAAESQKPDK